MSSLSTLPKGDSAWLLRKSIQRIMQQVSVLETNIGSSTTGNSSDTQIIFNDAGTLRGDSGLTYNKTTDLLSVGAATISGDLTVATNTLKTTSGNVGIGTVTPDIFGRFYTRTIGFNSSGSTVMQINGTTYGGIDIGAAGTRTFGITASGTDVSFGSLTNIPIVFNINSSQAMRLDSTGLGVGRSPSYRLQASSGTKATTASLATVAGITTTDADDFGIYFRLKTDATGANRYAAITSFDNGSGNGARDLVLQDLGGNVGIGVTPSAWVAGAKALQFGAYGALAQSSSGNIELSFNSYNSGAGAYKYLQTDTASLYRASSVHSWFVAPSGTAGNAITFTQAMTLDASGNLSLANGNLVIGTSGKGIDFSAVTGGTGTATGNVLNDYEEGTFTPIVRGSTTSGTGTYTTQFGRYTKVGRLVTVTVTLNWTAHTGTGNLQFAGLPFVSANTASAYDGIAIAYQSNISSAANTVLYGLVEFGSTVVTMTATPVGGGGYGLVAMDTAGEIAFTVTYTV